MTNKSSNTEEILRYVVANQLGGNTAAKYKDMQGYASDTLGGAALCVSKSKFGSLNGNAFVFLPIPTNTGLGSVGVNGYFELSSNRRDVWSDSDDLAGDGAVRSIRVRILDIALDITKNSTRTQVRARWNKALMRDVCACCFVRVLQAATSSPNYYNLFPSPSSCSTTWRPVLDSFYDIARTLPMFPFEATKKLLRVSEIVFANENTCPELISGEIMKLSDLAIVRVEGEILKTLTSGFPRIRVVSPDFVRKSFRELSVSSKAHDIFEYAIGDIRGIELARFYRNHVWFYPCRQFK